MGVLKRIWIALFGKSKKQEDYSKGSLVERPKLTIAYKKGEYEIDRPVAEVENKPKENISVTTKKTKKEGFIRAVGDESLVKIKTYLIKNGSLDKITCQKEFNIKSLRNFIWILRKDGLDIKTNKIEVYNDSGEKIQAVNYILLSKNRIIS